MRSPASFGGDRNSTFRPSSDHAPKAAVARNPADDDPNPNQHPIDLPGESTPHPDAAAA
jgi:hypothetical protein